MGLLRRSLRLLQARSQPTSAAPAPENAASSPGAALPSVEEMAYRIAALPSGFAAPVLLCSLLKEQLRLERAALLLYDARRHVFAPWASCGFDTTTRNRLRLAPGSSEAFNRAAAGELVTVTGEELETFRENFSSREFAGVSELLLVPFLHNQRLVGMLLIASPGLPPAEPARELLRAAGSQAAALCAAPAEATAEEPQEAGGLLEQRVEELLNGCRSRGYPLILIRLHLEPLLRAAQKRVPELEVFRLQEFLRTACRRLLQGIGRVEVLHARTLLLLVHGMKEADPPLLLHQVQAALRSQLGDLIGPFELDPVPESRIVTEEPAAALSFLRPPA